MLRVYSPITVTVLGSGATTSMSGTVLDLSGRGLRLAVPYPIPFGAAVKIETEELLMLAEVCRCSVLPSGYEAGLMVSEMLTGLSELRRLNEALLDERTRS
jgi:hypothetical protein